MHSLVKFAAIGILLTSSACLRPADSVKPKEQQKSIGSLSLVIADNEMAALAEVTGSQPETVHVQVFNVVDDKLGERESNHFFPAVSGGLYTISDLTLGVKEFQIDILGANQLLLAQGSVRHLVVMGPQSIDDLVLKRVTQPVLDLRVTVVPTGFPSQGGEGGPKAPVTEPAEVHEILNRYLCTECHSKTAKQGGYILSEFPYTTPRKPRPVLTILDNMIAAMEDQSMPTVGDKATEADIAVLRAFREVVAQGDGTEPPRNPGGLVTKLEVSFKPEGSDTPEVSLPMKQQESASSYDFVIDPASAPKVMVGATYRFSAKVYGQGGILLKEVKDQVLTVAGNGLVSWSIPVTYDKPGVTIRIRLD